MLALTPPRTSANALEDVAATYSVNDFIKHATHVSNKHAGFRLYVRERAE